MTALVRQARMPARRACELVGISKSSYYRATSGASGYARRADPVPHAERVQPTALTPVERQSIYDALTDAQWAAESVAQVYWNAFDQGRLTMSLRSFYRYAADLGFVGDRRNRRQRRRRGSERQGPVPAATAPGQVWSWDVTELRGPGRYRFKLYLAIDVYSRYPVAWRIEYREDRKLAVEMFAEAFAKYGAPTLIHSDNGAIMRSKELVSALAKAGVLRSYSRPRVSDDNPFSESLFRTVKYDLSCPGQFDDIEHARQWTAEFLDAYAHRTHSRMGWHRPHDLFHHTAEQVQQRRQARLNDLYNAKPGRFRGRPMPPAIPATVGDRRTHTQKHDPSQTG